MRECKKCGEKIPFNVVIDGRRCCLKNRKFCLDCNPYKNGKGRINTNEPPKGHNKPYREWSDGEKIQHTINIRRRGVKNKAKLVEMSGGKCLKCGYYKSMNALTFHHRDPKKKLFGLTLNQLWSKSWTRIIEEWKKCDLLCSNCHIELHDKALVS